MTVDEVSDTPDSTLNISHVTVQSISKRRLSVPIKIETENNTENLVALVDCGAEGIFIDKRIAHKWRKRKTPRPIRVYNVDGTINKEGEIDEQCLITFKMNGKCMTEWFYVSAIGKQTMILGLPWLEKHNPDVNWREKTLEFRDSEQDKIKASLRSICQQIDRIAMPEQEEDLVIGYLMSHKGSQTTDHGWNTHTFEDIGSWSEDEYDQVTIARYTPAQQMEHKYHQTEEVYTLPPEYSAWKDVFEKKASERFPESRSWDHQIELCDDFIEEVGFSSSWSPTQQRSACD